MQWPGVRLTVLAGTTIPTPLAPHYTDRLLSVTVTENDTQPSVFTLSFDAGRSRRDGALDTPGMRGSRVEVSARVSGMLTLGASTSALFDGVVTDIRLTPGEGAGAATLTVTGEDVSYLIDRVERTDQHPALDDAAQVQKLLMPYLSHRINSQVLPPPTTSASLPGDLTPSQRHTDLAYIRALAAKHGFVTYVVPGPAPGVSTFYWGPPIRGGRPQPALSVNLGVHTNVTGLSLRSEASAPVEVVIGAVLDRRSGEVGQIDVRGTTRRPLAMQPLRAVTRRQRLVLDATSDVAETRARAQAQIDANDDAVIATGTVDGARYRHVLRPHGLVGVRGAGWTYDGLWYVRQVVHRLVRGSYSQQFTLCREGHGSTVPVVAVGVS